MQFDNIDQRVKQIIGEYVVRLASMEQILEDMAKREADLRAELAAEGRGDAANPQE